MWRGQPKAEVNRSEKRDEPGQSHLEPGQVTTARPVRVRAVARARAELASKPPPSCRASYSLLARARGRFSTRRSPGQELVADSVKVALCGSRPMQRRVLAEKPRQSGGARACGREVRRRGWDGAGGQDVGEARIGGRSVADPAHQEERGGGRRRRASTASRWFSPTSPYLGGHTCRATQAHKASLGRLLTTRAPSISASRAPHPSPWSPPLISPPPHRRVMFRGLLDWLRSLFWSTTLDVACIGLQNAGKVRSRPVSPPPLSTSPSAPSSAN